MTERKQGAAWHSVKRYINSRIRKGDWINVHIIVPSTHCKGSNLSQEVSFVMQFNVCLVGFDHVIMTLHGIKLIVYDFSYYLFCSFIQTQFYFCSLCHLTYAYNYRWLLYLGKFGFCDLPIFRYWFMNTGFICIFQIKR